MLILPCIVLSGLSPITCTCFLLSFSPLPSPTAPFHCAFLFTTYFTWSDDSEWIAQSENTLKPNKVKHDRAWSWHGWVTLVPRARPEISSESDSVQTLQKVLEMRRQTARPPRVYVHAKRSHTHVTPTDHWKGVRSEFSGLRKLKNNPVYKHWKCQSLNSESRWDQEEGGELDS